MKSLPIVTALLVVATLTAPQCVVVHDRICFESQAQYDKYMGWDAKQQQLETEANK
jgi:hypothetical protein